MSNNENLIRFPQKNSKKAEKALNEVSLRNQLKHAKVVVFSLLLKGRRNIFGVTFTNLWKWAVHFWKSQSSQDKNLMHMTQKKLAGRTEWEF